MAPKPPIRVFVLEDEAWDSRAFNCLSVGRYASKFDVIGRASTSSRVTLTPANVDLIAIGFVSTGRDALRRFKQLPFANIATLVCIEESDVATGHRLMQAGANAWLGMKLARPSTIVRAAQLAAERGRRDRELYARIEALTAYRQIAEVLASPGSLKRNLQKVLRILVEATGAGRGTIRFPDDRRRDLVLYASVGPLVRTHPPQQNLRIDLDSQGGRCFLTSEVIVENYHRPGGRSGRTDQPLSIKAGVHVPIAMDGHVKATIGLGAEDSGFFTPDKVSLATAVGRELGPLVAAAQLRESLQIERSLREHRDDFISVVSHELRTPMTMMMGFSELLLDGEPDPETRQSWYEMIHSQTRRLAGLIDQMLNVSELQAGHLPVDLTMVDVVGVVKAVVDDCSRGYPLHRFSLDLPSPELAVVADVDMLRQVLRNLVDNAAKFSPEGGPVDVRVQDHPSKGIVTVAVEDEGIGVLASDRDRLFQTFARGSNPEVRTIQGVGLGLYASRSLSESMGCQINFSKRRGRGSRFSLEIPMAA